MIQSVVINTDSRTNETPIFEQGAFSRSNVFEIPCQLPICCVYMGLEQGRPQQFLMPDKGTGRSGGRKKKEKELQQAIQEFRKGTPSNILSTEPKISPSSSPSVKERQKKERQKPRLGKREAKELKQAIDEFKHGKPLEIFSNEPKLSPSSRAHLTQPHSEEIKQVLNEIEGEQ
jgi:hypothetical protein